MMILLAIDNIVDYKSILRINLPLFKYL